jgi:hypothetical protein
MSDPFVVSATASFEPKEAIPEGLHLAICTQIICLGTVTKFNTYKGKEESKQEVFIGFELCNLTHEYNGQQENRRIGQTFKHSLHENAGLTAFLVSWRGVPFTPQQLAGFDLREIMGKPAMLQVVQVTKGDKTYANIDKISKLPKFNPDNGEPIVVPAQSGPTVQLGWMEGTWNLDVFNSLPNYLKDKMKATPEYRALVGAAVPAGAPQQAGQAKAAQPVAVADEDLPF